MIANLFDMRYVHKMNKIEDTNLTKEQEEELLTYSRSSFLDYRYVVRAKVILMLAAGRTYREITDKLSIGKTPIAKWKKRYKKHGIEQYASIQRFALTTFRHKFQV